MNSNSPTEKQMTVIQSTSQSFSQSFISQIVYYNPDADKGTSNLEYDLMCVSLFFSLFSHWFPSQNILVRTRRESSRINNVTLFPWQRIVRYRSTWRAIGLLCFLHPYILMYLVGIVINKAERNCMTVLNNIPVCARSILGNYWDCLHYIYTTGRGHSL